MSNLAVIDNRPMEVEQTLQIAKAQALELYASAKVEEIMLDAAQKRLAVLETRRRMVLTTLNATDVAKLGDKLARNKYAAEKLHEIFGGKFEYLKDTNGRPLSDVQVIDNDPDVGTYRIYTYYGRYERPDGKVTEQMGSFSTKDVFFARAHDEWKTMDQINLVDVMVAAQSETYKKCIFRGTGLGDWTNEEATELLSTAKGHDFKGSQAGAGVKSAVIGFGKSKGKDVSELNASELDWYGKAYAENVANPERAKYKKDNQRILDAIKAEQAARAGGGPKTEEPAAAATTATAGGATRGQRLGELSARLLAACSKNQRAIAPLLRILTKESDTPRELVSELSDDQIDSIAMVDDGELATIATEILRDLGK